jgi:hypothetical protein
MDSTCVKNVYSLRIVYGIICAQYVPFTHTPKIDSPATVGNPRVVRWFHSFHTQYLSPWFRVKRPHIARSFTQYPQHLLLLQRKKI